MVTLDEPSTVGDMDQKFREVKYALADMMPDSNSNRIMLDAGVRQAIPPFCTVHVECDGRRQTCFLRFFQKENQPVCEFDVFLSLSEAQPSEIRCDRHFKTPFKIVVADLGKRDKSKPQLIAFSVQAKNENLQLQVEARFQVHEPSQHTF